MPVPAICAPAAWATISGVATLTMIGPPPLPPPVTDATIAASELAPLSIFGWQWSASFIHFSFHLALGATGYAVHRWALKRELQP